MKEKDTVIGDWSTKHLRFSPRRAEHANRAVFAKTERMLEAEWPLKKVAGNQHS